MVNHINLVLLQVVMVAARQVDMVVIVDIGVQATHIEDILVLQALLVQIHLDGIMVQLLSDMEGIIILHIAEVGVLDSTEELVEAIMALAVVEVLAILELQ